MSWFTTLIKDVEGFFTSPKAKAVEAQIQSLLPIAITIVEEINAFAPNRTLAEINTIATKYALPTVGALASGQTTGTVLLTLATEILQKNHAPDAAISVLNTVVQLAVTAVSTQ